MGGAVPLFSGGGAGSPLTQCRLGQGLLPYHVSSWSNQPFGHDRNWGVVPLWEGGAGSPSKAMWPRPTSTPKFHLYPSNDLATIQQRHRQTDRTGRQVQNSLCIHVLHSPILAVSLHGTQAVGISQTLRRGTRNRIMELLQKSPPILGRAAITSGIGPHSSFNFYCAQHK